MTGEEAKELLIHVLMTYEPRDQYGDLNDSQPYEEAITMAIEALSAEAVQGEWDDIGGFIRWGCPFCHHAYESRSNYCPNCGARMRGEEE